MAKLVTCPYCEERFDRETVECVKIGNRYYHIKCQEKENEEKEIIEQIHDKMKHLLGMNYNPIKINNQIKSLRKQGKTVAGILNTLFYWYDIEKNSAQNANGGIGIVEYVYGEAQNYWYRQYQAKLKNSNIDINDYIIEEPDVYHISHTPFKKPKRVTFFELD